MNYLHSLPPHVRTFLIGSTQNSEWSYGTVGRAAFTNLPLPGDAGGLAHQQLKACDREEHFSNSLVLMLIK